MIDVLVDIYLKTTTGVPRYNGKQHASEIAKMAFDLVRKLRHLEIPHLPGIKFTLRIGCHSGKHYFLKMESLLSSIAMRFSCYSDCDYIVTGVFSCFRHRCCRSGRKQDAEVLFVWGNCQCCLQNGIPRKR